MTLGQLIKELELHPPDATVTFDEGENPGSFGSYRGYYDQLALSEETEAKTVGGLLTLARAADGAVFHGYKGGEYQMSLTTPVWIDNPGDYSSRALISTEFDEDSNTLVLRSAYIGEYA